MKHISLTNCRIPEYTLYRTMHRDDKVHGETILIIRSDIDIMKWVRIKENPCRLLQASIVVDDRNGCITISAVHSPLKL